MFIATLIAASGLDASTVAEGVDRLAAVGVTPGDWRWVEPGVAADIVFTDGTAQARAALEGAFPLTDIVVQAEATRAKKLLVADMDSTMITVECIDELADYAGLKPQIAEVTERAMRGELDFAAALDARVALLRGLEESAIDRCLAERVTLMPGAVQLIRTMKANGARTVLVSGGFTRFADPVARQIGFDRAIANILDIADGALLGTVARPIVDAGVKRATLEAESAGIDRALTMAVGDGANDLAMIGVAGLGVAYHAKPVVAAAAGARIDHNDLSALLYAQGYSKALWA